MSLMESLRQRRSGLRFYGLTPPKRDQDPAKFRGIAERQMERIKALAPDGLILYDLQDEAGRTTSPRPFPFLPTLEPSRYAREQLAELNIPRILYQCAGNHSRTDFLAWADRLDPERDACVLVGAPAALSSKATEAADRDSPLSLSAATALLRERQPKTCLGGVAIAERHVRKQDEGARLLAKYSQGARFFISQTIYDSGASKALLADYALRFQSAGVAPVPFILSFSPCGSLKTMEFMKWLGIAFPEGLERDLQESRDILAASMDAAVQAFAEIRSFAAEKSIPIGINVESVAVRKEEIEASCVLFRRLSLALAKK